MNAAYNLQTADDLRNRFENLTNLIGEATAQIQSGKVTELGDMEKAIAELCAEIENAEPKIAAEMKPVMANMISQLDELARELTEYQTNVQGGA